MSNSIFAEAARHFRDLSAFIAPWNAGSNIRPPQTSPQPRMFLQLPLDILLILIDDHLSAADRLALSHTCRDLRVLATYNWPSDIRGFSFPNKTKFCVAFINISLDHWFCWGCRAIHAVDQTHTPNVPIRRPKSCKRYGKYNQYAIRNCIAGSDIWQNHVQLALKYIRSLSLNEAQTKYFKALTEPVIKSKEYPVDSRSPLLMQWRTIHPMILEDHYFLYQHYEYWPLRSASRPRFGPPPLSRSRFWPEGVSPTICPHLDCDDSLIYHGRLDHDLMGLLTPLQRIFVDVLDAQRPQVRRVTCDKCPTGCNIAFRVDVNGYKSLRVQIMKDLGRSHDNLQPPEEWVACTGLPYRSKKPMGLVPPNSSFLYHTGRNRPSPSTEEDEEGYDEGDEDEDDEWVAGNDDLAIRDEDEHEHEEDDHGPGMLGGVFRCLKKAWALILSGYQMERLGV